MTGRDLHARARSIVEGEERRIASGRPPGEMYDWAKLVLDQAAKLESLRDKESRPVSRVVTEQGELGDLPDRSVVLGADGVAHQASDNGAGLRFWGSEDQSYTFADGVALPAILIHTPKEPTP